MFLLGFALSDGGRLNTGSRCGNCDLASDKAGQQAPQVDTQTVQHTVGNLSGRRNDVLNQLRNLKPMKVSDGQLKMYRPITAFELVLFDGRTITVGFATPEEVSSLKWSVMSMLPNAECVEDGSIDRKACRKLNWDFKKKYSFRFGAFRRDFLD